MFLSSARHTAKNDTDVVLAAIAQDVRLAALAAE